jgi:hypothetical protein
LAESYATAGARSIGRRQGVVFPARPAFYPVRRETVPMPTACSRAMVRMLLPAARAARIVRTLAASSAMVAGRPSRVPSAFARASPAMTRSRISAFKLGKHAKHLKHRAAGRRGRVETLLVQVEIDALGVKILEHRQQVCKRSTQAVNRPCGHHINFTPGDRLHQPVESWAHIPALGSGDTLVGINGYHLPSVALGNRLQLALLIFGRLAVHGAGPNIEATRLGICRFAFMAFVPVSDFLVYNNHLISERQKSCRTGLDIS